MGQEFKRIASTKLVIRCMVITITRSENFTRQKLMLNITTFQFLVKI